MKALNNNKINEFDLIFPKLTPEHFKKRKFKNGHKTSLEPEVISPEECQKLIFEVIKKKIKEPNYYQINSFIKVLAVQLKKLNKNEFINAYELIVNGRKQLLPIRTFIVKSFNYSFHRESL